MNTNSQFHVAIRDQLPHANATSLIYSTRYDEYSYCASTVRVRVQSTEYRGTVRVPAHFQESKYKKEPCLLDFPRSEGIPDTSRILMEEENFKKVEACLRKTSLRTSTTFLEVRGHPY